MIMTENEICRDYRAAKNQSEQIKILADINCTTADEIKEILVAGGEKVVEPPKTNRGKKVQAKPETEEIKQTAAVMPEVVMEVLTAESDKDYKTAACA